ncbi:hypothetical protein [Caballeronia sordidicola]|uniref:hypothetical protein n=2 Tax=Burkholderiales TaxID=80840 RepID=UPI00076AF3EE|nr:hypothetical protein [Caballeronia sordidicola]AME25817.1 hypothetical protein AXG89_17855 [Burkholderia sp. PAMC 26561]
MKLESRMLSSIRHRSSTVVLRSDVSGLGSASQVSESLNALLDKGVIARIGNGIYAKSTKDPDTGEVRLVASEKDVATEVFQKLGISVRVAQDGSSGAVAVDIGSHRINRRLSIAGKPVIYVHQRPNNGILTPDPAMQIPTEGVSQFVASLARKHHISYQRTAGDEWAETVTRLSDDNVQSDETSNLLVSLKRAHKLTDREMTALLINHLREKRRV